MVTSARKSILISAMAEGGRTGRNSRGRAWQDLGFLLLRTISYFTYEMINRQSETARMAVLGSVGMDAVAPGSSGWIPYNHFISEI